MNSIFFEDFCKLERPEPILWSLLLGHPKNESGKRDISVERGKIPDRRRGVRCSGTPLPGSQNCAHARTDQLPTAIVQSLVNFLSMPPLRQRNENSQDLVKIQLCCRDALQVRDLGSALTVRPPPDHFQPFGYVIRNLCSRRLFVRRNEQILDAGGFRT